MATDIQQIINNLLEFYNPYDKTVIIVGAGGGQFIEYETKARQILAIDKDPEGLRQLKEKSVLLGLEDKFIFIQNDFYGCEASGDLVMFEFCLHEMIDPENAIRQAQTKAPEILIMDH